MNSAIICLGSNSPQKSDYVSRARALIGTLATVTGDSGCYPTPPEGKAGGCEPYLNELVAISTDLSCTELCACTKAYETEQRSKYDGPGVCIDIDIVIFNNEVLRPLDAGSAYFKAGLAILSCSGVPAEL